MMGKRKTQPKATTLTYTITGTYPFAQMDEFKACIEKLREYGSAKAVVSLSAGKIKIEP
jgi:hypothetical protein